MMESYSQMPRDGYQLGAKIISRKIIDEFVMVDKFFSSGVSAETILQESLEEVKSTYLNWIGQLIGVKLLSLENGDGNPREDKGESLVRPLIDMDISGF